MSAPARPPTGRRLRPILLGLIASVFAFLGLYAIVLSAVFWAGSPR